MLSPASHSLIVFFLKHPLSPLPDSVSSSADSSKIQLLSRRVQQKKWAALSTLSGARSWPRGTHLSLSHSHASNFSNRRLRLYFTTARQVDIKMIYTIYLYALSHFFFFFWTLQTEGILKYCTYLMFLDDCWSLCRMLPTSDTNGNWQQEALIDIHFCAYATHCLGVLIDLRCKTLNLHFLFFQFLSLVILRGRLARLMF